MQRETSSFSPANMAPLRVGSWGRTSRVGLASNVKPAGRGGGGAGAPPCSGGGGSRRGRGRRLGGGEASEGAGGKERGVGRPRRRRVAGVRRGVEPRLHHSPAASHFSISSPGCLTGDNEPKALAQGLASGNRWITRARAMALRAGNAPCCWRARGVRGTHRSLCSLTPLNLTPSQRSRVLHSRSTSEETAALSSGRTAKKQRRRPWTSGLGLASEEREREG